MINFLKNKKKLLITMDIINLIMFIAVVLIQMGRVATPILMTVFMLEQAVYTAVTVYAIKEEYAEDYVQMKLIICIIATVFFACYIAVVGYGDKVVDICALSIFVACVLWAVKFFKEYKFKFNGWLIVSCLIFLILNIHSLVQAPMSDSTIYYMLFHDFKKMNLYNDWVLAFNFSSHLSMGYSLFLCSAEFLSNFFYNETLVLQSMNMILAFITIVKFKKILDFFYAEKSNALKCLMSTLFVFAPSFLGLFWNVSVDYFMMCSFVWFLSAEVHNQKYLKGFFSFLFVFSKEPAILIYFVYVAVKYIFLYARQIKNKKSWNILKVIDVEFLFYVIPAAVWAIIYMIIFRIGEDWSTTSGNSWSSDSSFVILKIKQMTIMNFSWIAVILCLIALIVYIARKVKGKEEKILAPDNDRALFIFSIVGSAVGIIVSNLVLATFAHMRYIQVLSVDVALLSILSIFYVFSNRQIIADAVCGIYGILLLIQSFYGIDIVSKNVFNKLDYGNGYLISSEVLEFDGKEYLAMGDAVAYNQEATYYSRVLEKFIRKIEYDKNTLFIYPDIAEDWESHLYVCGYFFGNFRWDERLNVLAADSDYKLKFAYEYDYIDFSNYDRIYYLNLPYASKYSERKYTEADSIETFDEQFLSCRFKIYRLK
ncbi:MAG: hypothetical protein ACI4D4_04170 [Lachnospira sp.]